MSHTLRKVNLGNTALAQITIVNYTQGGEAFTLAELGLTGALVNVFILALQNPQAALGMNAPLNPVLVGNAIKLMDPTGLYEIPTTTALNFSFAAIVNGT